MVEVKRKRVTKEAARVLKIALGFEKFPGEGGIDPEKFRAGLRGEDEPGGAPVISELAGKRREEAEEERLTIDPQALVGGGDQEEGISFSPEALAGGADGPVARSPEIDRQNLLPDRGEEERLKIDPDALTSDEDDSVRLAVGGQEGPEKEGKAPAPGQKPARMPGAKAEEPSATPAETEKTGPGWGERLVNTVGGAIAAWRAGKEVPAKPTVAVRNMGGLERAETFLQRNREVAVPMGRGRHGNNKDVVFIEVGRGIRHIEDVMSALREVGLNCAISEAGGLVIVNGLDIILPNNRQLGMINDVLRRAK